MLSVLKESCAQDGKCTVISILGNGLSNNRESVMNDMNDTNYMNDVNYMNEMNYISYMKDIMDTFSTNDANHMNSAN